MKMISVNNTTMTINEALELMDNGAIYGVVIHGIGTPSPDGDYEEKLVVEWESIRECVKELLFRDAIGECAEIITML